MRTLTYPCPQKQKEGDKKRERKHLNLRGPRGFQVPSNFLLITPNDMHFSRDNLVLLHAPRSSKHSLFHRLIHKRSFLVILTRIPDITHTPSKPRKPLPNALVQTNKTQLCSLTTKLLNIGLEILERR